MTTITLHSNNKKALQAAIILIENDRTAYQGIETVTNWKVSYSFTGRVAEDAGIDFKFHHSMEVAA